MAHCTVPDPALWLTEHKQIKRTAPPSPMVKLILHYGPQRGTTLKVKYLGEFKVILNLRYMIYLKIRARKFREIIPLEQDGFRVTLERKQTTAT
jgi:hypothetical protein